jgi:hypothetical protein
MVSVPIPAVSRPGVYGPIVTLVVSVVAAKSPAKPMVAAVTVTTLPNAVAVAKAQAL